MQLSEDEKVRKFGKKRGHCIRNTLLRYEYEGTCIGCGYKIIKRKHELSKNSEKTFFKRLKYAEHKLFCICVDVYKNYKADVFDKMFELLSRSKKNRNKQYSVRKI